MTDQQDLLAGLTACDVITLGPGGRATTQEQTLLFEDGDDDGEE